MLWMSVSGLASIQPKSDPGKAVHMSLCLYVRMSICPALFRECTGPSLLKYVLIKQWMKAETLLSFITVTSTMAIHSV